MVRRCHRYACNPHGIGEQGRSIRKATRSARRPARADVGTAIEHELRLPAVRGGAKQGERCPNIVCDFDDEGPVVGGWVEADSDDLQSRGAKARPQSGQLLKPRTRRARSEQDDKDRSLLYHLAERILRVVLLEGEIRKWQRGRGRDLR